MTTGLFPAGSESSAVDYRISADIRDEDRHNIWVSANRILDQYDLGRKTVLALGYVQSGKTTSITALCAAAADREFRVVIAILGSTILLRNQNSERLEKALGLEENNYRWVSITEFNSRRTPREIQSWIERGRVVLLPVLKNPKMLDKIRSILKSVELDGVKCLVIDDEADQASLNTSLSSLEESSTYSSIKGLRSELASHLYVQYTATPYAPLLLDPSDSIMPEFVEFLEPGNGYTGGREFFVEHAVEVVREIPTADEQNARNPMSELPDSLEVAIASFWVGAAHLYHQDKSAAPISMLIHSTFKNDLQERYHFLVERLIAGYRNSADLLQGRFADLVRSERNRLYELGIGKLSDGDFWKTLEFVLRETTLWLVNSASEVKKVQWNLAPFHILIGGNKLDRGFTVEGLTVTYMNRPPSDQIDTLEQRARAFGYRSNLLPYCQFFATARTIATLKGIVHTEDDLRANLRDAFESGMSISDWAKEIGLYLPHQTKPTRQSVVSTLASFNLDGDWYALRKPLLGEPDVSANLEVLQASGLLDAEFVNYQRMAHRTIAMPLSNMVKDILLRWRVNNASPGWQHEKILDFLRRRPDQEQMCSLVLLANPSDSTAPRTRKWAQDTGFVNLFQGEDVSTNNQGVGYMGDRKVGILQIGENAVVLQVHHVTRRGYDDENLYTLAIHLGKDRIVKRYL